jgi:hypothetical protein
MGLDTGGQGHKRLAQPSLAGLMAYSPADVLRQGAGVSRL